MDLPSTSVSGGHGSLSAKSQFVISNQQDFGNFAKYMLAADRYLIYHVYLFLNAGEL
jgi:hypothetical protein